MMPQVLSRKMVKAKKNYSCFFSNKKIEKGETHECSVNKYDGEIYSIRVCQEALYVIDKLDMYGKGTDNDGFTEDDYNDILLDYINDNNLVDEYEDCEDEINLHDFVYQKLKEQENVL